MRLPLVLVLLCTAPALADEPPRLIQTMGIDARTLDPGPGQDGRAAVLFSRATYSHSDHTRGGVEMGGGPAHLRSTADKPRLTPDDRTIFYYAGLIVGLAFGSEPLTAGAELIVGANAIGTELAAMLEPRLTVELWLAPDISLGARLGSDLLRDGDLLAGLYLSVYTW